MSKKAIGEWFGLIGALIMVAAFCCAAWSWGYQLLAFARDGLWLPFSVNDGLFWLTEVDWFRSPDSWFGIHRILGFFNAGVGLLIATLVALMGVMKLLGLDD